MINDIKETDEKIKRTAAVIEEYTTDLRNIKRLSNMLYIGYCASFVAILNSALIKKDVFGSAVSATLGFIVFKARKSLKKREEKIKNKAEDLDISSEVEECLKETKCSSFQRKLSR